MSITDAAYAAGGFKRRNVLVMRGKLWRLTLCEATLSRWDRQTTPPIPAS